MKFPLDASTEAVLVNFSVIVVVIAMLVFVFATTINLPARIEKESQKIEDFKSLKGE